MSHSIWRLCRRRVSCLHFRAFISIKDLQKPSSCRPVVTASCKHQGKKCYQNEGGSSYERSYFGNYVKVWKEHPLPIWLGLLVLGICQFWRVQKRQLSPPTESLLSSAETDPYPEWRCKLYKTLPLNFASRVAGHLFGIPLPKCLRSFTLGTYVKAFHVNLDEAAIQDLEEYKSLGDFFRRRLRSDARPVDQLAVLTSPCDGRVVTCGPLGRNKLITQVKGLTYPAHELIGHFVEDGGCYSPKGSSTRLYQCTLYLGPGDYHCFHAPVNWKVSLRRHFAGNLMSVGPKYMRKVPNLLSSNERVAYLGTWHHGFFSFVAVGATNVGSISVDIDKDLKTNFLGVEWRSNKKKKVAVSELTFVKPNVVLKGDYFGEFNFGSTVVLVFEAPLDFEFCVSNGQKVLMGQPLSSSSS